MNKSLFNIREEAVSIYNEIEQADGELSEELELKLKINESELKNKSVGYVGLIKHTKAENLIIKDEIKRLQALVKRNDRIASHLENNLSDAMKTFNVDEIKTELVKINFSKSESVIIDDIQALPDTCKIIKVEAISKTDIKRMIKAGEKISGARIETNLNLQIK